MKQIEPMNSVSELNIFRLLRIARNIKVKDLAKELSISPAYVNAIESGDRKPSARLLRDYAIALGVDEEIITTFQPNEAQKFEQVLLSILRMIVEE